jgi:hypothetical protein
MAQPELTSRSALLEEVQEAITILFCVVDDTYRILNPKARRYESLSRNSPTQRSLPSPSCNSFEELSPNVPSYAT